MTEFSAEHCHGASRVQAAWSAIAVEESLKIGANGPCLSSSKSRSRPDITKVMKFLKRYCVPLVLATYIVADRAGLLRSSLFGWQCICEKKLGATPELAAFADASLNPSDLVVTAEAVENYKGRQLGEGEGPAPSPPSNSNTGTDSGSSSGTDQGGAGSSSSKPSTSDPHVSHPHEALFFMIGSIIIGTAITHACEHPIFEGVQQCVVLFVLGVIVSWILEGASVSEKIGVFGRSYKMWMQIDPHLLLFTMLPPLVTGDAMSIDTSVAKRVYKQCLFLAGPGVAFASFATALFLKVYLPYDWSFLLCLVSGSILCATDPVAVVALLKELGASPTLTVQIQGESLLNDGTAIVLYTIAYNMLKGQNYDVADIFSFLIKMAVYAWGLGMVIGYMFYQLIKAAHSKLHHHSSVVQVSLTICSAYASFIIAEGVFKISGVLSSVAAALVLAHKMWPEVANRESMETVWHMLEYLGNTVIFFLAGALSGKVMTKIAFMDYLHLMVIYVVIGLIRATLFFSSRPLLGYLHENKTPVSYADCFVMSWGGLRGAIGLALAIQVSMDEDNSAVDEENKNRVLFYVSGVAALTLIVNATTCPKLVHKLGITQMPDVKRKMLKIINRQLLELTVKKTRPGRVRDAIREILGEIENHVILKPLTRGEHAYEAMDHQRRSIAHALHQHWLEHLGDKKVDGKYRNPHHEHLISMDILEKTETIAPSSPSVKVGGKTFDACQKSGTVYQAGHCIVDELRQAKAAHEKLPDPDKQKLSRLGEIPALPFNDQEEAMMDLVQRKTPDCQILRYMCESFLAIVRTQYWVMIEDGNFFDNEAEKILATITLALSQRQCDLTDFLFVSIFVQASLEESQGRMSFAEDQAIGAAMSAAKSLERAMSQEQDKQKEQTQQKAAKKTEFGEATHNFQATQSAREAAGKLRLMACDKTNQLTVVKDPGHTLLGDFLQSPMFCGTMAIVIVANAVCVSVENERQKDGAGVATLPWIIIEIGFSVFFTLEFVLKFIEMRLKYFYSAWNMFDFVLVVLGIIGCVFVNIAFNNQGDGMNDADVSSEARLIRTVQVFKILRIVRLLRLWRLWVVFVQAIKRKRVDFHVAEHMMKTTILSSFIRAHVKAQVKLTQFFGRRGVIDFVELARIILQSRVAVYKALVLCETESHFLDNHLITHVLHTQESRAAARECEQFLIGARRGGVITNVEAEGLLEPIHEFMQVFMESLRKLHCGNVEQQIKDGPVATEEEAPILPAPEDGEPEDADDFTIDAKKPLLGSGGAEPFVFEEALKPSEDKQTADLDTAKTEPAMPGEDGQEPPLLEVPGKELEAAASDRPASPDNDDATKNGKERKPLKKKKLKVGKSATNLGQLEKSADKPGKGAAPVPTPAVIGVDKPLDAPPTDEANENESALLLDVDKSSGKDSSTQAEDTDGTNGGLKVKKWASNKKAGKAKSNAPGSNAPPDAL